MIRRTSSLAILLAVLDLLPGCTGHRDAWPSTAMTASLAIKEASHLDELAEQMYDAHKLREAISLTERSLALRERAQGPRHLDVATTLNNLALFYKDQSAFAEAKQLYDRALTIEEGAPGAMLLEEAISLNGLGMLYQIQGAYAKAEPLLARGLEIRKTVLGAMHPKVAESLNNLAGLYMGQGAYAKAEPLFSSALDIFEKTLGPVHPLVAVNLNNLAGVYFNQGEYDKAVPLLVKALAINEKTLGADHPGVATTLNSLALLYETQGAYGKAEPLMIRALAIWEKTLGPMHRNVGASLNNLAALYRAQGAYAKEEPLLIRALDIFEKARGPTHPDVASGLTALSVLYQDQADFAKAEPLQIRALAILENTLGPMHPEVANSLHNLASIHEAQGNYTKAKSLLIRALAIREQALGPMHPNVAKILITLASLYQAQGAYADAEAALVRAIEIRSTALGAAHPDVALGLDALAMLHWARGEYAKATPLMARAEEIHEAELRLELGRLSGSRKRALMALLQRDADRVVSLHADATPPSEALLELALLTVLRHKGRALDSLADNQLDLRTRHPRLRDKLDQLAMATTALSTRLHAPFDPRDASSRTAAITALRSRIEELEAELNEASAEFRSQSESVTIAKVQAALPRDAALVELVRYRRIDPRQAQSRQEERYGAYILPWHGAPRWIALGEATPIDAAVDAVLGAMRRGARADTTQAALRHLDSLVFGPLREPLVNISHIILAPDGKLNLVPFEALIDSQGHYELEERLVSYVTSGRDLLRIAAHQPSRSPATIVAAPDYGPPRSPAPNGMGAFLPLAGAAAEATEVPAYFVAARTLTGDQATKAALAATTGPATIHLATHGFYAREVAVAPTSSSEATGSPVAVSAPSTSSTLPAPRRGIYLAGDAFSSAPPPPSEDPTEALDRTGLALAGANVRPDGIVTARELASFDWWGTQLVVLSACDTGVGAVPSGEGVYGMRRALVLAGTESQVVSLWGVSDAATRELMRAFYGELARGTGRAEALRRAKLRLLRQPRFAHPYYWAAFIAAGDWTPLDPHLLKRKERTR